MTYKNAKDYEGNAHKMAAQGFVPRGQVAGRGRIALGRTAVKGTLEALASASPARKGDKITVTTEFRVEGSGPDFFASL